MALYIGNEKIGELYIGGDKIKQAYIGSELVYSSSHYTPNQVLYESSTGGASTTLNLLDDGKYQVICIAGGGGGAGYSLSSISFGAAGGGSGSGFNCIFQLTAGNYAIAVGSGGAAKTNGTATTGGDSRFGTCYARGGGGGKASLRDGEIAGSGGASPTLTYTRTTTTLNTAGNAGSTVSNKNTASGGTAVYSTYGKGGNGKYNASTAGTAGYVKVVYKGA
jgi:hypothetical protein